MRSTTGSLLIRGASRLEKVRPFRGRRKLLPREPAGWNDLAIVATEIRNAARHDRSGNALAAMSRWRVGMRDDRHVRLVENIDHLRLGAVGEAMEITPAVRPFLLADLLRGD